MDYWAFAQSTNVDGHFFKIGWVLQEVLAAEKNHTCHQRHERQQKVG
jgi:hypothetical protein